MPRTPSYYLGIDIGGTKCLITLLDSRFRVRFYLKEKTAPYTRANFIPSLLEGIQSVLETAKVTRSAIRAVGVGTAGMVQHPEGRVLSSPNLPFLKGCPLRETLSRHLRVPVFVENDVNAGLYGEFRLGSARGFNHVVGIFLGTGVGGALILGGQLYRGATGGAGEIGHTFISAGAGWNDPLRRGTVEGLTGRLSIAAEAMVLMARGQAPRLTGLTDNQYRRLKSGNIAKAIQTGDRALKVLILEKARWLGLTMANVVNLLNPEAIVLGGGLMESMGTIILPTAQETMKVHALPALVRNVKIKTARLKDFAVAQGAGCLAAESLQGRGRARG